MDFAATATATTAADTTPSARGAPRSGGQYWYPALGFPGSHDKGKGTVSWCSPKGEGTIHGGNGSSRGGGSQTLA